MATDKSDPDVVLSPQVAEWREDMGELCEKVIHNVEVLQKHFKKLPFKRDMIRVGPAYNTYIRSVDDVFHSTDTMLKKASFSLKLTDRLAQSLEKLKNDSAATWSWVTPRELVLPDEDVEMTPDPCSSLRPPLTHDEAWCHVMPPKKAAKRKHDMPTMSRPKKLKEADKAPIRKNTKPAPIPTGKKSQMSELKELQATKQIDCKAQELPDLMELLAEVRKETSNQ